MTIRACLRISVDAAESQSLDQQKHLITRWADYKHPGVPIEWYVDPGVSGRKPLAERPEGSRLLADLTAGDVLAVTKIDRLARNVADLLSTLKTCESVGATFSATEQDVSTEGAYGRFIVTLLGALAELEAGIVRERVLAARAQFQRDGRYGVGLLPYGFHAVKDQDRGWLVVRPIQEVGPCARCRDEVDEPLLHDAEGDKLREAALNVLYGATQTSQAGALGLPEATFRKLLSNPRLYGQTPGEGGQLDKSAGILSMNEWQQLQKKLGGPRAWSKAPGYGPVMHCYQCERRMYLDIAGDRYRCDMKHPGRPTIGRNVADDHIESYFLQYYGDAPVVRVRENDDGERLERLAELAIAIDQVATRLRDADDDVELIAELRELKQQRKAILAEPVNDAVAYEQTGQTLRELWAREDNDQARVFLLKQFLKFTVHPASRPEGRIDVEEFGRSPEDGGTVYVLAPGSQTPQE
ncbi:recombinase family protein [Jiangella endophytica]|uniref:recombinase family protein n=1 Tax=Jiangella endophytica TaxID=1623398 RepID=UPI000E34FEA7|nr:recombinase family protein [Jiangella endophytica]